MVARLNNLTYPQRLYVDASIVTFNFVASLDVPDRTVMLELLGLKLGKELLNLSSSGKRVLFESFNF